MEQLEVSRARGATGTTAILRLKGALTLASVHILEQSLREIGEVDTVIDVSGVPYIDSGGLGAILSRWSKNQRASRRFALTGTHRRIDSLLEITKVNTILPIFATPEDADRSFTTRAAGA